MISVSLHEDADVARVRGKAANLMKLKRFNIPEGICITTEAYGLFCEKNGLKNTGTKGSILLENMKKLSIDPTTIDEVFISHAHGDHTGGLSDFLKVNSVIVYVPPSFRKSNVPNAVTVREPLKIHENILSTGELKGVEQSLVVQTEKGSVVIVGCSHSGVGNILKAALLYGSVRALIGGLHGFNDFNLLQDLECVCPAHCTRHKSKIKSLHPEKYVEGGAGRIIEL